MIYQRQQPINTPKETGKTMFQKPKGTVDYYPNEFARLQWILNSCRKVAGRNGFREIETPAFEDLKLLSEKEGDEISEQIFVLEKRGEEAFGLRFDMTVPCARLFTNISKSLVKPVKWSYATRMWRYERPQKGRLREFYQFGVELFGSARPDADAEVINLAIDCMKELGLTNKDVFVSINNRKLLQGILMEFVSEENVTDLISTIDKRKKIAADDFISMLREQKVTDPTRLIKIIDITDIEELGRLNLNTMARQGYEEIKEVMGLVNKTFCRLSLSTARGLSYYTGTVFEIFDTANKYRSVCGGGRYDNMIGQFGGEQTPATGFSIGPATLQLVLDDAKKKPSDDYRVDTYVAVVDDSVRAKAREILDAIRKTTSADIDLTGRSLAKQFDYASKI